MKFTQEKIETVSNMWPCQGTLQYYFSIFIDFQEMRDTGSENICSPDKTYFSLFSARHSALFILVRDVFIE
jgi:hypothetical protein